MTEDSNKYRQGLEVSKFKYKLHDFRNVLRGKGKTFIIIFAHCFQSTLYLTCIFEENASIT